MFTFLVTQSLRNRMLVLALSAALMAFGGYSASRGCRSMCCPISTSRSSPS